MSGVPLPLVTCRGESLLHKGVMTPSLSLPLFDPHSFAHLALFAPPSPSLFLGYWPECDAGRRKDLRRSRDLIPLLEVGAQPLSPPIHVSQT